MQKHHQSSFRVQPITRNVSSDALNCLGIGTAFSSDIFFSCLKNSIEPQLDSYIANDTFALQTKELQSISVVRSIPSVITTTANTDRESLTDHNQHSLIALHRCMHTVKNRFHCRLCRLQMETQSMFKQRFTLQITNAYYLLSADI